MNQSQQQQQQKCSTWPIASFPILFTVPNKRMLICFERKILATSLVSRLKHGQVLRLQKSSVQGVGCGA